MKNKKTPNFFLLVIILVLGPVIYKQFDFENLRFEKPALSILYIIIFAISIYLLVKRDRN